VCCKYSRRKYFVKKRNIYIPMKWVQNKVTTVRPGPVAPPLTSHNHIGNIKKEKEPPRQYLKKKKTTSARVPVRLFLSVARRDGRQRHRAMPRPRRPKTPVPVGVNLVPKGGTNTTVLFSSEGARTKDPLRRTTPSSNTTVISSCTSTTIAASSSTSTTTKQKVN
jgi:hypothetical protein